jgi:hypothetical protein
MNKRVELFFQNAEDRIMVKLPKDRAAQARSLSKRRIAKLGFIIICLCSFYLLQTYLSSITNKESSESAKQNAAVTINPDLTLSKKSQTIHLSEKLPSYIPAFYLGAVRQIMQPVPLRKADLMVLSEADELFDPSLVVLDKVIVIPKIRRAIF